MRLGRRLATGVAEHPSAPAEPVEVTEPRAEPAEAVDAVVRVDEAPRPAELAER